MQTDFNMYSKPFIVGQRADCSLSQIDSFVAEADIKFGSAVKRGTNKDKQALPSDGTEFLGIVLRDDLATSGLCKARTMVSVMTKGRVAVPVIEAVVAGDKAYLQTDGTFNKTKGEKGLEIGTFVSTQELENNIAILEI